MFLFIKANKLRFNCICLCWFLLFVSEIVKVKCSVVTVPYESDPVVMDVSSCMNPVSRNVEPLIDGLKYCGCGLNTEMSMTGLGYDNCQELSCLNEFMCGKPELASFVECKHVDVSLSFDTKGYVSCDDDYFLNGLLLNSVSTCNSLECIEGFYCCKYDYYSIDNTDIIENNWWDLFAIGTSGEALVEVDTYLFGFYRSSESQRIYNLEIGRSKYLNKQETVKRLSYMVLKDYPNWCLSIGLAEGTDGSSDYSLNPNEGNLVFVETNSITDTNYEKRDICVLFEELSESAQDVSGETMFIYNTYSPKGTLIGVVEWDAQFGDGSRVGSFGRNAKVEYVETNIAARCIMDCWNPNTICRFKSNMEDSKNLQFMNTIENYIFDSEILELSSNDVTVRGRNAIFSSQDPINPVFFITQ